MRTAVTIVVLVFFLAAGVDMIIRPRRHMNSFLKRGGEMLREWNEMQVQGVGLLVCLGSGWLLYTLIRAA